MCRVAGCGGCKGQPGRLGLGSGVGVGFGGRQVDKKAREAVPGEDEGGEE